MIPANARKSAIVQANLLEGEGDWQGDTQIDAASIVSPAFARGSNLITPLKTSSACSGAFSWTKSTPRKDSFRFAENLRLFLSAPKQTNSAPPYMGSKFIRRVGVEDTCVLQRARVHRAGHGLWPLSLPGRYLPAE